MPTKVEITEDLTNPHHYTRLDPEPIDVIEGWGLGFHEANILKYVARYKEKGGIEDLKKAKWYLDRLICSLHV
ncbi:MAG: DUF3310 domain-containing protein [Thermodesulfobacteriota bacterium]